MKFHEISAAEISVTDFMKTILRCDVGQFVRVELILALLAYEKYVFGPDLNWHGSKLACEVMPGVASHPWLLVYGALTTVPVGR